MPCVVHTGYTPEEIVGLADEDNENDEYHAPVSLVDTWLSYKALADAGWTQERIARAKGFSRPKVTERLKYADMSTSVLECFVRSDFLKEGHAAEIVQLSDSDNLAPWLTLETAMLYVIETVTKKDKFTAKDFKAEVDRLNGLAAQVEVQRAQWEARYFNKLLNDLQGVYTGRGIQGAIDNITRQIATDKRAAEEEARAALNAAEAGRVKAEREERAARRY